VLAARDKSGSRSPRSPPRSARTARHANGARGAIDSQPLEAPNISCILDRSQCCTGGQAEDLNLAEPVYVFKVALAARKDIWRRIAAPPNPTLDDLHEAIYAAFDRYDEHMYSFFFPARPMTSLRKIYDSPEYAHPYNAESPDGSGDERIPSAAKARLQSLGLKPKQRFSYLFDFGDSW